MTQANNTIRVYESAAAPGTNLAASRFLACRLSAASAQGTNGVVVLCDGGVDEFDRPLGVIDSAYAGPSAEVMVVIDGYATMLVGAGAAFTPGVNCMVGIDAAGAAVPVTFPLGADQWIIGHAVYQNGQARTAGQGLEVKIAPQWLTA